MYILVNSGNITPKDDNPVWVLLNGKIKDVGTYNPKTGKWKFGRNKMMKREGLMIEWWNLGSAYPSEQVMSTTKT